MGDLKMEIFTSNLFLIEISFIMLYPSICTLFLDPFYLNPHIVKYELWKIKLLNIDLHPTLIFEPMQHRYDL